MLKSWRQPCWALLLLLGACGKDAGGELCRLVEVDGDAAARVAVTRVDFRFFATADEDVTFLSGEPAAQRRYDTAVPTSLTVCKGASAAPVTTRVFGTDADDKLVAASDPTLIDFSLALPVSISLRNGAIVGGDVPRIVPSSEGLTVEAIIADMKTPITPPGFNSVLVVGVGDGARAYIGMGVMVSDALNIYAPEPPASTHWRGQRPALTLLYGEGHADNGSWRVELANLDFQVFSRSQDRWIRPAGYPANPSALFVQGPSGTSTGSDRHDGQLPLSSVYTMPTPGTLGTSSPALLGATRPGYQDVGDGTDVFSVFISAQARLVPSGVGAFNPGTAILYLEVIQEILEDLTFDDGNYNGSVGHRVTAVVTTHTFTLFRDDGDAIDVQPPHNPARLDEMPDEAWLRAHPPIGVTP